MSVLSTGCPECASPADALSIGNGKCNKCDGTGVESFAEGMDDILSGGDGNSCRRCGGSGDCPRCGGTGEID
jgi:hypothetical protein